LEHISLEFLKVN